MMARQPQMLQMSAVETGQMSSVETGQMSAVETGQMTAAETSVLSQQKTSVLSQQETSVLSQHQFSVSQTHARGQTPIWPEMGRESTVWPETWSRSMPGLFRSLWDGSNPLQGATWPGPGGPSRVHNVGSGPNHRKWPEMGRESTVWPETKTK